VNRRAGLVLAVLIALSAAGIALAASIKVTVDYDKEFNFATVHTFAWHPDGPGEVKMLQSTGDDPAKILAFISPTVGDTVEEEMEKRGFKITESGAPDLHLHYYLLVGPNSSSQYHGQFVGAVPAWGLPDFAMSTSALKIYEEGTLVLDISLVSGKRTVWRAIARAEINRQVTDEARTKRLGQAVREMLKNFPPKFKKK